MGITRCSGGVRGAPPQHTSKNTHTKRARTRPNNTRRDPPTGYAWQWPSGRVAYPRDGGGTDASGSSPSGASSSSAATVGGPTAAAATVAWGCPRALRKPQYRRAISRMQLLGARAEHGRQAQHQRTSWNVWQNNNFWSDPSQFSLCESLRERPKAPKSQE